MVKKQQNKLIVIPNDISMNQLNTYFYPHLGNFY